MHLFLWDLLLEDLVESISPILRILPELESLILLHIDLNFLELSFIGFERCLERLMPRPIANVGDIQTSHQS